MGTFLCVLPGRHTESDCERDAVLERAAEVHADEVVNELDVKRGRGEEQLQRGAAVAVCLGVVAEGGLRELVLRHLAVDVWPGEHAYGHAAQRLGDVL